MKARWIADQVLNWSVENESGVYLDSRRLQRAYDHLLRAEHFLNSPPASAADRADCISNLRKSLTHRLRLFEAVYNLQPIVNAGKKRPYLKILAEFGVVRPFLLELLLKVRNAIEYRDIAPPAVRRCREFIDVVWYFLRSTDSLLSVQRTGIIFRSCNGELDSPYWISVDISYRPRFTTKVSGWIAFELVSKTSTRSTIPFQGITHTRTERWKDAGHRDKRPEDIWINGRLMLLPKQRVQLIASAFNS
jgi:hypothetical protein